ncbi:3-oxoacyl-ACP reductase [Bacillus sp. M6-12]|uniref:elongation factor P 5-aminopentanone reductase n=1 Tax=Bacillus sp. M6-12 TaxID=2054166 RepID=UPI000C77713B|nr:SDR family oxidoreductase [Bacillus sp. M6-12]PLS16742.1 3-oxoacyl-ACP reductase [Bacillus sp. M6-12]
MEKRFALITGASGGIGRAIARKLAKQGYSLYLHYNQNSKAINELMAELEQPGIELIPLQADLGEKEGYKKLVNGIFSLHAIVLNSGNSYFGLISDMKEETIEQMILLHASSPFLLTQALLPKLYGQKNAGIVAVTSIWGQTGASCEVLYSMLKGGQNAFIKSLSKELALSGIRVNAVAPGAIATGMLESFNEDDLKYIKEDIPMGRIGTPDETANAVSFLLSPESSYITGQILAVNGGWYT